ncbi:hypothetical protein [Pseudomonas sp. P108]|uniref:hypothetical protein n=1 Tax=Pseudomonas sp. P108 TaxID=1837993 RepID=UPI0029345255|nr:hypothetical protein [Pseudomonas sp. P108]WNZ87485.1 hypothetical protein QOM10_29825 [Pseudomonas sp. P108]
MLNKLTKEISNKRFLAYTALLYILAVTASGWVPVSSPIFSSAPYIKLALIPCAQAFLICGARYRWPTSLPIIMAASTTFYLGMIVTTIRADFF